MLRYIRNILHGYIAHWNNHYNAVVTALWARCNTLRSFDKKAAEALVVSSNYVMSHVLGPDRIVDATAPLGPGDLKRIVRNDYVRLHIVLLQGFAAILSQLNPPLEPRMRSIVGHLAGAQLDWRRYESVKAIPPDPAQVAWSAADAFTATCPLLQTAPVLQPSLVMLILANAKEMVADIRDQGDIL